MVKKQSKSSLQLGIRLDNDLMQQIQKLAEWQEIDRNSWIKQAIASAVQDDLDVMMDQITENYIKSRIDETEYLEYTKRENIPVDVKEARELRLRRIVESEI